MPNFIRPATLITSDGRRYLYHRLGPFDHARLATRLAKVVAPILGELAELLDKKKPAEGEPEAEGGELDKDVLKSDAVAKLLERLTEKLGEDEVDRTFRQLAKGLRTYGNTGHPNDPGDPCDPEVEFLGDGSAFLEVMILALQEELAPLVKRLFGGLSRSQEPTAQS